MTVGFDNLPSIIKRIHKQSILKNWRCVILHKLIFLHDGAHVLSLDLFLHRMRTHYHASVKQVLKDTSVVHKPGNPPITVYKTQSMHGYDATDAILILNHHSPQLDNVRIGNHTHIVIDSQNRQQIDALTGLCNRPHIISCGRLKGDTVTFSSVSAKRAVISLQRTILDVEGNPIDPMERILLWDLYDPSKTEWNHAQQYAVLACAAIEILLKL